MGQVDGVRVVNSNIMVCSTRAGEFAELVGSVAGGGMQGQLLLEKEKQVKRSFCSLVLSVPCS